MFQANANSLIVWSQGRTEDWFCNLAIPWAKPDSSILRKLIFWSYGPRVQPWPNEGEGDALPEHHSNATARRVLVWSKHSAFYHFTKWELNGKCRSCGCQISHITSKRLRSKLDKSKLLFTCWNGRGRGGGCIKVVCCEKRIRSFSNFHLSVSFPYKHDNEKRLGIPHLTWRWCFLFPINRGQRARKLRKTGQDLAA